MIFVKRKITTCFPKRLLIFSLIFFSFGFFGTPQRVSAGAWGEPIAAAEMKFMMETIRRSIEGTLMGSLKMAAVQMLNSQIGQLIGGGAGGQPRFITNYNDFLYRGPQERTSVYMDDFFTMTMRGRGSSANYTPEGIGGNYIAYMDSVQRQASVVSGGPISVYSLDEYGGMNAVVKGNPQAFYAFISNPCNNPYGCALQAEKISQNKLAMEQQAAAIEAQSTGFLGAKQGDMVITPAGSIQAVTVKIQNLPTDIIAAASNPTELLSGVVTAMANKVVTNLVQQGIGQVQATIQREINGVTSQVNSALRDATNTLGPVAPFAKSVIQQGMRSSSTSTRATPPVVGGVGY